MSCKSINGILHNCNNNLGGIKRIFVSNSDNFRFVKGDDKSGNLGYRIISMEFDEKYTRMYYPDNSRGVWRLTFGTPMVIGINDFIVTHLWYDACRGNSVIMWLNTSGDARRIYIENNPSAFRKYVHESNLVYYFNVSHQVYTIESMVVHFPFNPYNEDLPTEWRKRFYTEWPPSSACATGPLWYGSQITGSYSIGPEPPVYSPEEIIGFEGTPSWREYNFKRGNASLTSTQTQDMCHTELRIKLQGLNLTTKEELMNLLRSEHLHIVCEDYQGVWHVLGVDGGLSVENIEWNIAEKKEDGQSTTIKITDDSFNLPMTINDRQTYLDIMYPLR